MEGNRRAGHPNGDQLPESGLVGFRMCFVFKFGFGCVWFSGNLLQREQCYDTVKSWLSALGKSPVFLSWPCPFRKQTWPCSKLSLNNNNKKTPHCTDPLYFQRLSHREWVPLRPQQELSRVFGSVSNDGTDRQLSNCLQDGVEEKVQEGRWTPLTPPSLTPSPYLSGTQAAGIVLQSTIPYVISL